MAEARDRLQKLTECCICFHTFTDPRTLPCIHTFCLECLKQTEEALKKKPEESMPCPLCRKPFVIPTDGMYSLQKNFFMENLLDVAIMLQLDNKAVTTCDMCTAILEEDEQKPKEATMRCLECRDNFCEMCAKMHKLSKLSKTHNIVKIGSETEEDISKMQTTRNCAVHNQQPLNFYCADCKKIICVSCFVENHASHKCKDVTMIHNEFRQAIEMEAMKISKYVEEMKSRGRLLEQRKMEVLLNIADTADKLRKRNLELKELIDSHTNSLMEELSLIKQKQIKNFASETEEVDRICDVFNNFETYCIGLISKGSASDVCGGVDELRKRSAELDKDHKAFVGRTFRTAEVSFIYSELQGLLSNPNTNIVGRFGCKIIRSAFSSQDLSTSSVIIGTDQRESDDKVTDATDDKSEDRAMNEDCGITFSEALAKYKVMLETIQEKITRQNLQSKDKKSSPFLKKEEVEQLRQQFNHVSVIRPDKKKSIRWRRIEHYHDRLVRSELEGTAGFRFKLSLGRVKDIIENMLINICYILDSGDVLLIMAGVIQNL